MMPLYKTNGYIENHNGNNFLTLVYSDEREDALEKYEELWKKIKNIITAPGNS